MTVAGVLLAAGGSRRLGTPKQLLQHNGSSLVALAARQLLDAGCAPVLVIVGAHAADIRAAVSLLSVVCVDNEHWERGMGTSIAMAISTLSMPTWGHVHSAVIASCDMPAVSVAHLRALTATAQSAPHHGVRRVASAYHGPGGDLVLGIPALLPRADWPALAALDGDQGARRLLRQADTATVFLRDGDLDLDTPADVHRWRAAEGIAPPPPSEGT
jgi:CTP:molybdopterin cytidylyltransferase MocA